MHVLPRSRTVTVLPLDPNLTLAQAQLLVSDCSVK